MGLFTNEVRMGLGFAILGKDENQMKYEFTGEMKKVGLFGDIIVRRIRATIAFGVVKAGDLGGWIEKEENLSQEGDAWVYGDARVYGDAEVYGDARVCGDAWVCGDARVCGDAWVLQVNHFLVIGPIGSRNSFTTFFRDKDKTISVKCGCFLGKIDRFIEKVQETHGDNKYALVYRAVVEVAKAQIDLN